MDEKLKAQIFSLNSSYWIDSDNSFYTCFYCWIAYEKHKNIHSISEVSYHLTEALDEGNSVADLRAVVPL